MCRTGGSCTTIQCSRRAECAAHQTRQQLSPPVLRPGHRRRRRRAQLHVRRPACCSGEAAPAPDAGPETKPTPPAEDDASTKPTTLPGDAGNEAVTLPEEAAPPNDAVSLPAEEKPPSDAVTLPAETTPTPTPAPLEVSRQC